MSLVLGLDMGGTASRAVLSSLTGHRYGTGRAGPGNPFAHPPAQVAAAMGTALRRALGEHPASRVRLGLIGMAGGARLAEPAVASLFQKVWRQHGLTCPMRVVGDTEVAFAAGTPAPHGTVLIAGTGAVAATITDHRMTGAAGGYGWLLGDEGAGFWLGREAVRALLAVSDGRHVPGPLSTLVRARLSAWTPSTAAAYHSDSEWIVAAVDHTHPVHLARLAPLVSQAAQHDDPVAVDIVARAASHLYQLLATARPQVTGPVVLAGSVVAAGTPVGTALRARFAAGAADGAGAEVYSAGDGAAGAAWLAARSLASGTSAAIDADALHRMIVGPPDTAPV